jgi:uncharacterized membrane protein YbaN (DUF454 family)
MRWSVLLRRIGGTAVFILGIVSLVLPVLPGWVLIGAGLYILSKDSPGMQGRIHALRARYHRVDRIMSEVERRFGHQEPKKPIGREVATPEREV